MYGFAVAAMMLFAGTVFANNPMMDVTVTTNKPVADVSFKLSNDTGAAFDYWVDGTKKTVKDGQTVGVSLPAGTQVYHDEGGAQGSLWFEVTDSMNGKKFNVSDL